MIYLGNGMYSDSGSYLQHHGVKGQKWGVRNGPPYPINKNKRYSQIKRIPNAKHINNYKGSAYFISENRLKESILYPRIPKNFMTENNYEDNKTPRISFAPSVGNCLAGLSKNVSGKTFYVYSPVDISKCDIYKPNKKAVPDSDITNELWIINPTQVKLISKIKVTGNLGKKGKIYSYGNKKAELFDDWIYEETQHDIRRYPNDE